MRKRYDDNVIVIVVAFSNTITVIFVDLFDDARVKLSARQIITSTFKHVLTFF